VNIATTPVADWRAYTSWAKKQAFKFHKKTGKRFELQELQNVAVEAMGEARGGWEEAVNGALADFAQAAHRTVRPVEMQEHDTKTKGGRKKLGYRSTRAEVDDLLEAAPTPWPEPSGIPCDDQLAEDWRKANGVRVCPPPRRIRRRGIHPVTGKAFELSSRIATSFGYQVDSRHGKVVIPLRRSSYIDGMGDDRAEGCSRKLASLFDDEANSGVGDARPEKAPQRGDIDNGGRKADVAAIPAADKNLYQRYTEKGGGKRWAQTCLNHGETIARGLDAPVPEAHQASASITAQMPALSDTGYIRDDGAEMREVVGSPGHYLNRDYLAVSALILNDNGDVPPKNLRKLTPATLVGGRPRWRRPHVYEWTVYDYIYRGPWNAKAKTFWALHCARQKPKPAGPPSPWQEALIECEGPKCTSPAFWRNETYQVKWGLRADVHLPPGYFFEHRVADNKTKWLWIDDGPPVPDRIAAHLNRWDYIEHQAGMSISGGSTAIIGTVRTLILKPEYLFKNNF
jgi:hypothetical protein